MLALPGQYSSAHAGLPIASSDTGFTISPGQTDIHGMHLLFSIPFSSLLVLMMAFQHLAEQTNCHGIDWLSSMQVYALQLSAEQSDS